MYRTPEDAWGLELWREALPAEEIERSRDLYDDFYFEFGRRLDELADTRSVRRARPAFVQPPARRRRCAAGAGRNEPGGQCRDWCARPSALEPRRRPVPRNARRPKVCGRRLDVRENVRFRGGELCRWVDRRYGGRGCALAIEFKKVFMDEWTGELDEPHLEELRGALAAVVPALIEELAVSRADVTVATLRRLGPRG